MGYLNEVFNTYYESTNEKQKNNIKEGFKKIVWGTLPYIKLDRFFSFKVSYDNITDEKALSIFEKYQYIEYKILKSRYNINDLDKEDLIKARINSNYGKYFDKEIYLKKEYYRALAQNKNIYFNYLRGDVEDLENEISVNDTLIEKFKEESLHWKYDMEWNMYKLFINMCFDKIFDNYKTIDKKINEGVFYPNHIMDWDEDNYIIGYVNKSLNGYLKNYLNELKGNRKMKVYIKCECCGNLVEKKSKKPPKYCKNCAKQIRQQQKNKWKRDNWNTREEL